MCTTSDILVFLHDKTLVVLSRMWLGLFSTAREFPFVWIRNFAGCCDPGVSKSLCSGTVRRYSFLKFVTRRLGSYKLWFQISDLHVVSAGTKLPHGSALSVPNGSRLGHLPRNTHLTRMPSYLYDTFMTEGN